MTLLLTTTISSHPITEVKQRWVRLVLGIFNLDFFNRSESMLGSKDLSLRSIFKSLTQQYAHFNIRLLQYTILD